jgi:hypothetical protein
MPHLCYKYTVMVAYFTCDSGMCWIDNTRRNMLFAMVGARTSVLSLPRHTPSAKLSARTIFQMQLLGCDVGGKRESTCYLRERKPHYKEQPDK